MKTQKIHFVKPEATNSFVWGKGTTVCGLNFELINEYTDKKEYVNCKKCIKNNKI